MNGGNNILPTMSTYGREMDHNHYSGLSSSGNSNMLTSYPILYQNNHHGNPAGDLLTLQMQLQGNSSSDNENTLAALQRNWIALQQSNNNVNGNGAGGNGGMLHSSIHHQSGMPISNDEMNYMRNLIPIGGSNSSPLHSNQSTLLDSLKFGSGLEPPNQVSPYGHHHLNASNTLQPSIMDNSILVNSVGVSGMNRNNATNIGASSNGRLQMSMNPNAGLGVNVDMVQNNNMLPLGCGNALGGGVVMNANAGSNIEWQGGIPIRNIPDLMTMLDLSDIPPHVQIPKYYEGIKISLGEAGREILRCYINQRGIRGKFMSSSNLQQLLRVAHQCGLWNAAVRLHLEFIGEIPMTASHAEMRKYKSLQTKRRLSKRISVLSKFGAPVVRRADGEETIEYRDGMKLSLGVDGRKLLLKRIRETRSSRENEINSLFSKYGLKYSQLRNATIHELCRMAYVCGLWEEAVKLHFQHIRKKAHENNNNQQESGSDLDSEIDINKERVEDEMLPNSFLQQLNTPRIDLLNGNGPSGNLGPGGINQGSSIVGSMGVDSVHNVNSNASGNSGSANHLHSSIHHPSTQVSDSLGRFGISALGNTIANSNSDNKSVESNIGGTNVNMHPLVVNSSGNNSSNAVPNNHALTGDHINYDDYSNYILDGANSSTTENGSKNKNSGGSDSNGVEIGNTTNDIINKVLGNTKSPSVNHSNNGIDNEGLLGISTGALGAFIGQISNDDNRNDNNSVDSVSVNNSNSIVICANKGSVNGKIPGFDGGVNVPPGNVVGGSNYENYPLLTSNANSTTANTSVRKKSKVNHPSMDNGNNNINGIIASNEVSHPNTSSFVIETISGILGDESIDVNGSSNDVSNNNNKSGNNLSSLLGNDVNINQNNDIPQLSAVVVLATAKAAEAAQNTVKVSENKNEKFEEDNGSKDNNGINMDNKNISDTNVMLKSALSSLNGDSSVGDNNLSMLGKKLSTSYSEDFTNNTTTGGAMVPLDCDEYNNSNNKSLDSVGQSITSGEMLENNNSNNGGHTEKISNDNGNPVVKTFVENDQVCFSSKPSNGAVVDGCNGSSTSNNTKSSNDIPLVSRGLTTQSTTYTSIESTGN
ncbi:PE_PGRS protein [Cryptosporidium bovis]|uniref:PE_PGRS protein n=1 Tax=Cryptosporidium bovis TaxID=310047 RepID=UPI00351A746E|nr:PE_PGRS protein [Cryptosporidium bovis]